MITNETIGRITCPVCGEVSQDVRINKNGYLYMICDNSCRVNFTKAQSLKWLPLLRAGQDVRTDKIYIKSLMKGIKENESKNSGADENRTRTILSIKPSGASAGSAAGNNAGTITGNAAGRIELNGRPTDTGNSNANKSGGFFARLLADDPDDE